MFRGFVSAHLVKYVGVEKRGYEKNSLQESEKESSSNFVADRTGLAARVPRYPAFTVTNTELKDKAQIFKNLNELLLNKLNIVEKSCQGLIEMHGFSKVIEHLKT